VSDDDSFRVMAIMLKLPSFVERFMWRQKNNIEGHRRPHNEQWEEEMSKSSTARHELGVRISSN
jgi:hypothetical protein